MTNRTRPEVVSPPDALEPITFLLWTFLLGTLAGGIAIATSLRPVQFVLALSATALGIVLISRAMSALAAGQRWGLQAVQWLIALALIVGFLVALHVRPFFAILPDPVLVSAGFAAAAAVPVIVGADFEAWAWQTSPRSELKLAAFVALLAVATVGSGAAASVPDPTQVSSDALTLRATATCRPGSVTVSLDVIWSQTDMWSHGPLGHTPDSVDFIVDELNPGATDIYGSYAAAFTWTVEDRLPGSSETAAVTPVGEASSFTPDTWSATGDAATLVIAHESLRAGHDYFITGTSATNDPTQLGKRLIVRYRHDWDRFTKQIEVACG